MQSAHQIMKQRGLTIISGNLAKPELNPQLETTSSKDASNNEGREIIDRLFLKLAAVYGNSWRNQYKSAEFLAFAKQEWLDALAGFEEKFLYQGITICIKQHKFPPNIAEFIECCNQIKKKNEFFKREEYKKAHPKVAEMHLNKIKNILNMNH